jgi:4-hydroxy-tetrahydrodipicolinate synthase
MMVLRPGVWGVLPTPFHSESLAVDTRSLETLVAGYRRLAVNGDVAGLVALGVFGEAARLSADERVHVLRTVAAAAAGLEIVAGIAFADPAAARDEAARLAAAVPGLRAVMVQVSSADPEALVADLSAVHQASGLPIVVQDYPLSSGVRIEVDALANAVNALPCVTAVKCESPPTSVAIARLAPLVRGVPLFGGLGGVGLLDELCAGASGAMTGFSYPEALVAVVAAWRANGFAAARDAIAPWLPLMNFEGQLEVGLGLRKEHLRRRGLIASASVRAPGVAAPEELRECIARQLATVPVEVRS